MDRYGRTDQEWATWLRELRVFIEERARLGRLTNYSEVNTTVARRTGLRPFDFELQSERNAMGALLGQISRESVEEGGPMISAIVIYLDRNDAGGGFYHLAIELGLLRPEPTARQRDEFWARQVAETHRRYARPRRR